jgi:hypothetical protein
MNVYSHPPADHLASAPHCFFGCIITKLNGLGDVNAVGVYLAYGLLVVRRTSRLVINLCGGGVRTTLWGVLSIVLTSKDVLEGQLDVSGVKGGGLNEGERVLLCVLLCSLCGDFTEVSEISFVTNKHDNDVGRCVLPQFGEPPLSILEGLLLGDIVHKESPNCTSVIPTRR